MNWKLRIQELAGHAVLWTLFLIYCLLNPPRMIVALLNILNIVMDKLKKMLSILKKRWSNFIKGSRTVGGMVDNANWYDALLLKIIPYDKVGKWLDSFYEENDIDREQRWYT